MPVINGRYYMNPAMGAAIEEARALLERNLPDSHGDQPDGDPDADDRARAHRGNSSRKSAGQQNSADDHGPRPNHAGAIQRIEIEVAESGPKRPGPKTHGYVAHVHRTIAEEQQSGAVDGPDGFGSGHSPAEEWQDRATASKDGRPGMVPHGVTAPPSTAHVFTNTSDLVDFLRDVLQPE